MLGEPPGAARGQLPLRALLLQVRQHLGQRPAGGKGKVSNYHQICMQFIYYS